MKNRSSRKWRTVFQLPVNVWLRHDRILGCTRLFIRRYTAYHIGTACTQCVVGAAPYLPYLHLFRRGRRLGGPMVPTRTSQSQLRCASSPQGEPLEYHIISRLQPLDHRLHAVCRGRRTLLASPFGGGVAAVGGDGEGTAPYARCPIVFVGTPSPGVRWAVPAHGGTWM